MNYNRAIRNTARSVSSGRWRLPLPVIVACFFAITPRVSAVPPAANPFVNVKTPLPPLNQGAIGDGIANDRAAIQNAINWCRSNPMANGGGYPKLIFPTGIYKVQAGGETPQVGLDVTGFRNGQFVIDFQGSKIDVRMKNSIMIDLSDSKDVTLMHGYLGHPKTFVPGIGVLMTRTNRETGGHHLLDLYVGGTFKIAAIYNYGAENIVTENLTIGNQILDAEPPAWGMIITCTNMLAIDSPLAGVQSGMDNVPCSNTLLLGTDFRCTTPILYLDGASNVKMHNTYIKVNDESAAIVVDTTNRDVDGLSLTNFSQESKAGEPDEDGEPLPAEYPDFLIRATGAGAVNGMVLKQVMPSRVDEGLVGLEGPVELNSCYINGSPILGASGGGPTGSVSTPLITVISGAPMINDTFIIGWEESLIDLENAGSFNGTIMVYDLSTVKLPVANVQAAVMSPHRSFTVETPVLAAISTSATVENVNGNNLSIDGSANSNLASIALYDTPGDGEAIWIQGEDATAITVQHEASTVSNRIKTASGLARTIHATAGMRLIWSSDLNMWIEKE